MRNLRLVLVVLAFFSCHKKEKEAFPGLTGTWMGIGHTQASGSITPPDAFWPVAVHVIDNNTIAVFRDTLPYNSGISNDDSAVFKIVSNYNPALNFTSLVYNKRRREVLYISSGGSSSGSGSTYLSSAKYHPNPFVKNILKKLSGTRAFSGTIHDLTFWPRRDTTYETSVDVTFTIVNDSVLAFNRSILIPGGDTLHYKATDNSANTVTFETFHLSDDDITTVMYNTTTDAVTIKEWRGRFPGRVDVDLK
ncbi:MAG: hypothetical protein KF744_07365 [Taibaiella sp.]|nr:hypothetical protein [Taibaiella sp.]